MTRSTLPPSAYTIGWISIHPPSLTAARVLLDTEHTPPPFTPNDTNTYILGRMSGHNIAIASPPHPGICAASQSATNMMRTFRNIRYGLMVGVGGGVPGVPSKNSSWDDVRLGDVVVSRPCGRYGGVVQYDKGKWTDKGFVNTSHLNKPPILLINASKQLESDHSFGEGKFLEYLNQITAQPSSIHDFNFPSRDQDILIKSDNSGLVTRLDRPTTDPAVHYGLIGSGDAVMKCASRRNELRNALNVSCLDTESAGLMDGFPCLVIRGIANYSDRHKDNTWLPYAAAVAAAYAKDLLGVIPEELPTREPWEIQDLPHRASEDGSDDYQLVQDAKRAYQW